MLYNVFFITNAVNTIGYRPMLYSLSVANPQVSSTLASKSKSTAATFCRLWLRRQCGRAIMLQNATLYVQERYRDVTSFCSFSVIFIGHYWCRDLTCKQVCERYGDTRMYWPLVIGLTTARCAAVSYCSTSKFCGIYAQVSRRLLQRVNVHCVNSLLVNVTVETMMLL